MFTKFALIAAAAFAATVSAQSVSDIPACGLTCLLTPILASGCSVTDYTCICTNSAVVASATTCIPQSCTVPADLTTTINFINSACVGQPGFPVADPGAEVPSPSATTAPATTAPATTAPATTTEAATTTHAVTPPASTPASGGPTTISTITVIVSSCDSEPTHPVTHVPSGTAPVPSANPTTSKNSTFTTAKLPTKTPDLYTGAAASNAASSSMVLLLLAGLAAWVM